MMVKSYSEKLKDPRWQRKRLEVFNRDDFKCILCGDESNELHVHHKSYEWGKEPWDYELDNFQSLCKNCHLVTEWMKDAGKEMVSCEGAGNMRLVIESAHPDCVIMLYINQGDVELGSVLTEALCKRIIKQIKKFNK